MCEYPEFKDDVIVHVKGFTYASKGIRLRCVSVLARQTRKNAHSKCLADSTWSVQNFSCSGKIVYSVEIHVYIDSCVLFVDG